MNTKQRLNTLRSQTGKQPVTPAAMASPGNDLTQRLARLQHTRHHTRSRREPLDDATLGARVGGRVIADGLLLIERALPLPHAGLSSRLPALPEAASAIAPDWAFIDTETTGLAGGSGTLAFMLGIARVQDGRLVVRQYLLSRFAGERAMLAHALDWLDEGTGLVSYNGKSFDLPLLKTRTRLVGLEPAAWERAHLDLLHGVRRCFDGRWPDCRLITVETRLLGIAREDDLPGSEAPAAWLAHLQQGDPGRLRGVLDHNRQDLASLGALLCTLAEVQQDPATWGADTGRIARAWLRQGDSRLARRLLEAADGLAPAEQLLLAKLRQRGGAADAARDLLESLVNEGVSEAAERLAKYHEHKTRDLQRAAHYTRRLPDGPERARRLDRLAAKTGRNHKLPF